MGELKAAHKNQDLAGIDASMEKLNAAWQAASQEMYAAGPEAGGAPSDGAQSTATNDSEDVTDVNFEEVK